MTVSEHREWTCLLLVPHAGLGAPPLKPSEVPEEGFKVHGLSALLPEQWLTYAGRYCEAMVAAN